MKDTLHTMQIASLHLEWAIAMCPNKTLEWCKRDLDEAIEWLRGYLKEKEGSKPVMPPEKANFDWAKYFEEEEQPWS